MNSVTALVSFTGLVFGMQQSVVKPPTTAAAPAVSVQFRDRWYLDDSASYAVQARSHRSQEEDVHIG